MTTVTNTVTNRDRVTVINRDHCDPPPKGGHGHSRVAETGSEGKTVTAALPRALPPGTTHEGSPAVEHSNDADHPCPGASPAPLRVIAGNGLCTRSQIARFSVNSAGFVVDLVRVIAPEGAPQAPSDDLSGTCRGAA